MSDAGEATVLGRYELLQELGRGGFGTVYEAIDRSSAQRVALKELVRVSPDALAAFKREFRAVQELHHPNLVRLDALVEERGKWLIAMELIEGTDLLAHVYADLEQACFDEQRLRGAFYDLTTALEALHVAGFVHRDLKPSNVRVTPAGRVVLLDFGLAVGVDPRAQTTREAGCGTLAYMAPEQALSSRVGPAADFYALGVCLYEALTGVLPLEADNPLDLLHAKHSAVPALASTLAPGVPPDLDALCSRLLSIDPGARPSADAIKRVLSGVRASVQAQEASEVAAPFGGREQELAMLRQAFASARDAGPQMLLIEGDSGIGKSALSEHFLATLDGASLLRGRCYENELLGYKAFDGAMDGLTRLLNKLEPAECEAMLPPRAGVLCRMFPALAAVKPLGRMPRDALQADPGVQRLEAFGLFARLLANLSQRTPIVLAIDDLHWADVESFRLLSAWLQAGASRCWILATLRPPFELDRQAAAGVELLRKSGRVQTLALSGLPADNAAAFVRSLVGRAAPELWVQTVVREGAGHPLFMTVLARYGESRDARSDAELTLDAAIGAQLGALSKPARTLLATAALVGTPLAASLCARAAGLDDELAQSLASELCRKRLLRRRGAGEIACFHDRIRHVALQHLPLAQAMQLHRAVASTLGGIAHIDPSELARHWQAAGEHALAQQAYVRGAEQASSSLAFDRAAELYRRALQSAATLELAAEQRCPLLNAYGHALARSGRSAEAAQAFEQAAQHEHGDARTRLRLLVAEHLLQAARVEAGMSAARALLAEVGVSMPQSTPGLVARIAWDRGLTALGGEGPSSARPSSARVHAQLEALAGLALPLAWHDPVLSAALNARHARLARGSGEPLHLARALSEESFSRMLRDPDDPRVMQLMQRARALCDSHGDPKLDVGIAVREAQLASARWDVPRWRERLEHAQTVASRDCPEHPWLLTNARIGMALLLRTTGQHARLAASTASWLVEARERDDRFARALLEGLGLGSARFLMADDPDQAKAQLDEALAAWPREPFSFVHLGELLAVMDRELYRGGPHAQRHLERERPRLERGALLKTRYGKSIWTMCRGAAAIAALEPGQSERNQALLREVRACRALVGTRSSGLSQLTAVTLDAQLALTEGDPERALRLTRAAREYCERVGSGFVPHCLAYLEGQLEGGEGGARRKQAALDFLRAEGWQNPRRAVAIMVPANDHVPELQALARR